MVEVSGRLAWPALMAASTGWVLLACSGSASSPPPMDVGPMPSAQGPAGAPAAEPTPVPVAGSSGAPVIDPLASAPASGCRAAVAVPPMRRDARWLALRGSEVFEGEPRLYLTRVGESGPGPLHDIGACNGSNDPGSWSVEGRFFAFASPAQLSPRSEQSFVVDVDVGDVPLARTVTGAFLRWAPRRSRLVTFEQPNTLWFWDGEQPDAPRSVTLPPEVGPFFRLEWSSDGRYLALSSDDADALYVFDVDATVPRMSVHREAMVVGDMRWSPGAHRLVYGRGIDTRTLMLLDQDASSVQLRTLSERAVAKDGNFALYTWLDTDRLLIDDASGTFRVVDVSGGGIETTMLTMQSEGIAMVLPGQRCALYRGRCPGANESGTCVLPLAPGLSIDVGPIFSAEYDLAVAGPLGSPVLLSEHGGHGIFEIDLGSVPFRSRRITAPDRGEPEREVFAVAPGSTPRWVSYADAYTNAVAPNRPAPTVHFWNRFTERRHEVDPKDLVFAEDGEWSADGLLFATTARTRDYPPARAPLVIQRLGEDEILSGWTVERFVSFRDLAFVELEWQP